MGFFHNKLVAITGAASGIGLATAKKIAAQGALLSIADINADALSTLVPTLSALSNDYHQRQKDLTASNGYHPAKVCFKTNNTDRILATPLDITDPTAVQSWITATTTHFSRPLSAAANMAGIVGPSLGLPTGSIRQVSTAEFERVINVNMLGTWNCLRAELPAMSCPVSDDNTGKSTSSIVNASSIAGLVGVENNSPYVMAKHAIAGLTKTAAKEEGRNGIRVNAIAPGIIDTPLVEGIKKAAGTTEQFGPGNPGAMARMGTSEEVAGLVCFLLGEESSFISGMVYGIDGGWIC
ncbi:MAG: hypothetical protein L6R42_000354 [Xanthoria sp. 1 TBL-2021]|nr:MAG: hypothetical protein L6R42_000354 [Xanthoria sp. 1 TBL-2021]